MIWITCDQRVLSSDEPLGLLQMGNPDTSLRSANYFYEYGTTMSYAFFVTADTHKSRCNLVHFRHTYYYYYQYYRALVVCEH